MPRVRPKLTAAQQLARQARAGQPVQRVEIPRTTCPRCGRDQWAAPDGTPRAHQRAARPGDDGYSAEFPVMVVCAELTLAQHHASVPDALRVQPELMPAEVREASAYATDLDALLDAGVPVDQLPSFQEWRVNRG